MSNIGVQTTYTIINYDNGKYLEKDDGGIEITFYDEDLGKSITLEDVTILDIDDISIEIEDCDGHFHNIDINWIVDFDY